MRVERFLSLRRIYTLSFILYYFTNYLEATKFVMSFSLCMVDNDISNHENL